MTFKDFRSFIKEAAVLRLLSLVLLSPETRIYPAFVNGADPDQLASSEASEEAN